MKNMKKALLVTVTLFTAVTMSACGGGGNGGDNSISGPAVSKGVVTALGSIFVNGVEFNTTTAAVKIDDAPSAADLLKPGMVVTVRGTADDTTMTGTATHVEASDALEGTISAVGANTVTVMGQTVAIEDNVTRLNDDNNMKTLTSAGFVAGDRVEVHGFADDRGGLRATSVVKKTTTGEIEIKGFVVSSVTGSFGLALSPGGASVLTVTGTLPAGAVDGSFVEVRSNAAPVGGAITATTVQLEDSIGASGVKVEVEGIVMNGGTVDSFTINGQKVVTNASTIFVGGLKADFAVGTKVEAEGPLDANGTIVAVKVSFRSNIKIEANVTAVSATSLTILGKTIAINTYTVIEDAIALNGQFEVRAKIDRDGNLIATRIRARNSNKTFLQAPVTVTANVMSVLGTAITTNAATQFRISTDAPVDQVVSAADFFAQVKSGVTVVKVRWATADTTQPVEEAEIQLGK